MRNGHGSMRNQLGPGRPVNGTISHLRAKLWFQVISDRIQRTASCENYANTAYGVEHYYFDNAITHSVNKKFICSNKFNGYKNGKHLPDSRIIDWFDVRFPGTRNFYDHPFWSIATTHIKDIETLHMQVAMLHPDVAGKVFHTDKVKCQQPYRFLFFPINFVNHLNEQCDWDAFSACIALIHEAEYYGEDEFILQHYVKTAINIFFCIILCYPLSFIGRELFEYLNERFFLPYLPDNYSQVSSNHEFETQTNISRNIITILKYTHIIRSNIIVPPAYLYYSRKYLTSEAFSSFQSYIQAGEPSKIKQHRAIRNLKRCLKRKKLKSDILAIR